MKIRRRTTDKNQLAFTLLELLIAMVILALLTGLGIQSFGSVQKRSRDSRRKQDLANIAKALETYYNDFGQYPLGAGAIEGCGTDSLPAACSWDEAWQKTIADSGDTVLYMVEMPKDPSDGATYYYDGDDGTSYTLFAKLENEDDIDIVKNDDGEATVYQYAICSEDGVDPDCSYYLSSSNKTEVPGIVE